MPRGRRGSYHKSATRFRSPAILNSSTLANGIGHPLGTAGSVSFEFPNRRAAFQFVARVAAGRERRVPVIGANADCDGYFAGAGVAYAMHDRNRARAESLARLCRDALELRDRHRLVGLIGKSLHDASVAAMPAHGTEKCDD